MSYLRDSTEENYVNIWKKTVDEDGIITKISDGEKKIINDYHNIFFEASPDFELMHESYPCEIVSSNAVYFKHFGSYVFNQNSPSLPEQ